MYKKLDINFDIPEELEYTIDTYLQDLNGPYDTADDCYQAEIQVILNWCARDHILEEWQIRMLRDYYEHGGILERGRAEWTV